MGNQKSTGKFLHGKAVPKSRPTMFWDHQEYEMPFHFNEFIQNKEQRDRRHKIKLDMAKLKQLQAEK